MNGRMEEVHVVCRCSKLAETNQFREYSGQMMVDEESKRQRVMDSKSYKVNLRYFYIKPGRSWNRLGMRCLSEY